jgi:precorrin-2 dehydrogenase / sirohydrochlorin ferrochelatase
MRIETQSLAHCGPMDGLYPVMLRVRGRDVLVVGGGPIAARKVEGLVQQGAIVTVIAPDIVGELIDDPRVSCLHRRFVPDDVSNRWLVITATNDPVAQQLVFDTCEARGIWCNAADDPDRCAFILPAVHRVEPVIVSVSTGGASPALAGWLRDRAADAMPPYLGELVARLSAERDALHAQGRTTEGLDWRSRIDAIVAELEADPTR